MAFLLVLASSSARAEWLYFADIEGSTVYVDFGAIKRQGDLVRLWALYDHAAPRNGALSYKAYLEINCKEETIRTRAETHYTSKMGHGEPLYQSAALRPWYPISPDALDNDFRILACSDTR